MVMSSSAVATLLLLPFVQNMCEADGKTKTKESRRIRRISSSLQHIFSRRLEAIAIRLEAIAVPCCTSDGFNQARRGAGGMGMAWPRKHENVSMTTRYLVSDCFSSLPFINLDSSFAEFLRSF